MKYITTRMEAVTTQEPVTRVELVTKVIRPSDTYGFGTVICGGPAACDKAVRDAGMRVVDFRPPKLGEWVLGLSGEVRTWSHLDLFLFADEPRLILEHDNAVPAWWE